MKIEIDINRIVEEIDVNKLVEETIKQNVSETVNFENIIDSLLDNKEVKESINRKIIDIINEYISSEKGEQHIIDTFKDKISDSDILTDDIIIDLVAQFLKKTLIERHL